jgi:hypothetical protein
MPSHPEQKIHDLCKRVIEQQHSPEVENGLLSELRDALHEHLDSLRDGVAKLALRIAAESESKAAD